MSQPTTARISARSTNIDFHERYGTGYCIPLWLRDEQIKSACKKVTGRIQPYEGTRTEPIAVVGYGPSLQQTWEQIKDFHYIISTSGAHRFLIDRGLIPTWHADVDPRAHKIAMLGVLHPDVIYCPCSTCHPTYIDMLVESHVQVQLWHSFTSEMEGLRVLPVGEYALTGGCDIGMRAMALARFFGFVDLHIFGMDGCASNDVGHAGVHTNPMKKFFNLEYPKGSGTIYRTSPALMEVAKTVPHETDQLKLTRIQFYGEGLVQAMMRAHTPKPPVTSNIAFVKPVLITDTYRVLNRDLHETVPEYGMGGHKHAEAVLKICESLKTTSVLDYGCGKGTLAREIPFPIWEYDPAIPGKDMTPRQADIVVCTDVLEHIEPDKLHDVLHHLKTLVKKVGYFVVSTRAAKKTLADGRNAHLIQRKADWWKAKLAKYFDLGEVFTDQPDTLRIVVGVKTKAGLSSVPQTTVERHGTKATFVTSNETLQWRAKTLFTKEPVTIEWIETFEKGEVLWDVGANMGGYTVWAGKHRQVEVYSFEPEADTYAVLCQNIRLNQIHGLAFCLAITDRPALSTLYLSNATAGGSCHSFGQAVGPDLQARDGVPQGSIGMTLDQVSDMLPSPHHLKIDVDGFEHLVLAGGKRILTDSHLKSLLIEVNTNLPAHQQMVTMLDELGYTFDQAQVDQAMRKDGAFKGCAEYVFRRVSTDEQFLLNQIAMTPLTLEPFPHLVLTQVWPDATYHALLTDLPPDESYASLESVRGTKGYPERSVHACPASLAWMRHGRLRRALDRKFGVISQADETLLIRDRIGYTIPPHTDTPAKVVTMLTFLGEARHGTSLYAPNEAGFSDAKGLHQPRAQFTEQIRTTGAPNTAFLFARTDTSFHGTEPYCGMGSRDVLLYDSRKDG
jgi:FkbM family methyltransferase